VSPLEAETDVVSLSVALEVVALSLQPNRNNMEVPTKKKALVLIFLIAFIFKVKNYFFSNVSRGGGHVT
jgi:hypothetical protein